jgi:dihydroorotate dehydrogenase
MYQSILKPLLFLLDPEKAHHLTVRLLTLVLRVPGGSFLFRKMYEVRDRRLERKLWGLTFPNPVGLAAGFDKDGRYFESMSSLGFGFIEIGTVTPLAQPGNETPRLFRLPQDEALINRMGFNNEGVEALTERLRHLRKKNYIIGGNIGKNKVTPNENAIDDYIICFEALYDYVDYFVVNVSSPNTPGLRELQEKEPLMKILSGLMALNHQKPKTKPMLLKIAPDLTWSQIDDIIEIVMTTQMHGIVATNTTSSRDGLKEDTTHIGAGGLSGAPVRDRSTAIIRYIYDKTQGRLPIIGVGGIGHPKDALEKLDAGATLVQVYSGLVYYGPSLVRDIQKAVLERG